MMKDYQVMMKLGSGSFGIVHKARVKSNNEIVVLKQVDLSKMDGRLRQSALNQAKIMKELQSPYIVKYYHSFLEKNTLNIIMEYCQGGDLAKFIKGQIGKPLEESTICKFTLQIMIGLRDLHHKKILHRDIKALNVFLEKNNNIRIGDLGVAKEMKADFANTIVGTPYYLSPEMCQEKPYNDRTDIWAMGCLIYQLCTGKHPFEAQNQAALALKIVMGKYKDIPNHYSKELNWVIKSCLSVDHKRRPTASYLLSKSQIHDWASKHNLLDIINQQKNKTLQKQLKQVKQIKQVKQVKQVKQIKEEKQLNLLKKNSKIPPKPTQEGKKIQENKLFDKKPIIKKQIPKVISANRQYHLQQKRVSLPGFLKYQSKSKQKVQNLLKNDKINEKQIKLINQKSKITNDKKQIIKQQEKTKIINYYKKQVSIYQHESVRARVQFEKQDIQKSIAYQEIPKDSSSDSDVQKIAQLKQQYVDQSLNAITPQKIQVLNSFSLKPTKQINWNIDQQQTSKLQQLPTIKIYSNQDQVSQIMIESTDNDEIEQQINDNIPFKFQQSDQDMSEVDEELIQIDVDEHQVSHLQKRIYENQKRKTELQNLKKHHQSQLLSQINKQEYQQLKEMVIKGTQEEVQKLLKKWMKNSIGLTKFYKILHYDIEIERCNNNIKQFKKKIDDYKKIKSM